MMNPEIKTKWVEALRSGEYQQGKRALKCNDTYCCLGVLSELYASEKKVKFPYSHKEIVVPRVKDWAGLDHRNPSVIYDNNTFPLSVLNDDSLNFKELADLIEEQL